MVSKHEEIMNGYKTEIITKVQYSFYKLYFIETIVFNAHF